MPGHIAEHVALVDDHGIPDPSARWLLPGGIEHWDNACGDLNGRSSLVLREGRQLVIVRPIPQAP